MISLKRHIDAHVGRRKQPPAPVPAASYSDLVAVVAGSASRACPALDGDFQKNLRQLRQRLADEPEGVPEDLAADVESEVDAWGRRASEYYGEKAAEIREMMMAMMEAAKAVGQRDQQYGKQFQEVSLRLRSIDKLEDLTEIRHLVNQTAEQLRSNAERMVEEGARSIAGLRAQMETYEQRVEESRRLAETDALTGLSNRAGVERAMEERVQAKRRFSLLVCDLNDFKRFNDVHGHLVGDELLKAFGAELRGQFRTGAVVGRWGGDEFVAILEEGEAGHAGWADRIRKWTFGAYDVPAKGGMLKVNIAGAIGIAAWEQGMSAADVFGKADQAMYADKEQQTRQGQGR